MSNQFVNVLSNVTYTENDMVTNRSSLDPHLDLFYRVGNRSKDATVKSDIPLLFVEACRADESLAIKIMGWSRSVRSGAGVREHLRKVLDTIENNERIDWSWFGREGYWKDIFYFAPSYFNSIDSIISVIKTALAAEDNLILKYLPRAKKNKAHKNNKWIKVIREALNLTPKAYRVLCSSFVTPEAIMCRKEWGSIEYAKVPSISMHRNLKSFYKHDEERIKKFIEDVKSGKKDETGKTVKMNVSTLYPHQIIMPLMRDAFWGTSVTDPNIIANAEAQWSQLPSKFKTDKKIFVIADNSESMNGEPMAISKALAIYLSERIEGAFHNFFSIFSDKPVFMQFKDTDTLMQKLHRMNNSLYANNTNLEGVFEMVLHKAVSESIPVGDMPDMIMIISDMQFDHCIRNPNYTALEMIRKQYSDAGYVMPALVFWNVRDSHGTPAKANDKGIILFSGASPNSISQAITGEIDPVSAMLRVVDKNEFYWLLVT